MVATETIAETGTELIVRPKVLRRPAQFSNIAKTAPISAAPMMLVPHNTPAFAPTTKAWQDDGRFAVVLLAIIIAMNIMVTLWLSMIHPAMPHTAQITQHESSIKNTPTVQNSRTVFHDDEIHVLDSLASPPMISQ